jgi:hypothetical protein
MLILRVDLKMAGLFAPRISFREYGPSRILIAERHGRAIEHMIILAFALSASRRRSCRDHFDPHPFPV